MVKEFSEKLHRNIALAVFGQDAVIDRMIASLLAGGHVILEDMTGTGKYTLTKALAVSLGCQYARIRCTPDLLPEDVIGRNEFSPKTKDFAFRSGAVFTDMLLADEINRTPPKTQNALIDCMEEYQVSDGETHYPLNASFFVIASQTPVQKQNLYPLSESQLDRFLMSLRMGCPEHADEKQILAGENHLPEKAVSSAEELLKARKFVQNVYTSDEMSEALLAIAEKTRTDKTVQVGLSTRGLQAMHQTAKAWAAMHGRDYLISEDIRETAPEVIAHRLIMKGGEILQKMEFRHESAIRMIEEVLGYEELLLL